MEASQKRYGDASGIQEQPECQPLLEVEAEEKGTGSTKAEIIPQPEGTKCDDPVSTASENTLTAATDPPVHKEYSSRQSSGKGGGNWQGHQRAGITGFGQPQFKLDTAGTTGVGRSVMTSGGGNTASGATKGGMPAGYGVKGTQSSRPGAQAGVGYGRGYEEETGGFDPTPGLGFTSKEAAGEPGSLRGARPGYQMET